MDTKRIDSVLKYFATDSSQEELGICCTTVGFQSVKLKDKYPILKHPDNYNFSQHGRVLNEYQLVYIIDGSGYFNSTSCEKTKVNAGTVIVIFPGERHYYHPDINTGWTEYWVGFKGNFVDALIERGIYSLKNPLLKIGIVESLIDQYNDIIKYGEKEKPGFLLLISSIVYNMLGKIYYTHCNYNNTPLLNKINQAKIIMRESLHDNKPLQCIAHELGMSYSWFRKYFKEQTGISPNQYLQQLKLIVAKEMLGGSELSISEIAYNLGFESVSHFSFFFKNKEGITATDFRNYSHPQY
ncbi:AraC family transcriptional regulator [uncultured Bacteroides sp.]|uniref:AraC family transcriptional regulator n=1 Tax=uncultured Bacteroides sp. TaxID=162156 RepID=UPI002631E9F8|nr:AraC family transcriptional regulator [uncultured Bacteroides sp.]